MSVSNQNETLLSLQAKVNELQKTIGDAVIKASSNSIQTDSSIKSENKQIVNRQHRSLSTMNIMKQKSERGLLDKLDPVTTGDLIFLHTDVRLNVSFYFIFILFFTSHHNISNCPPSCFCMLTCIVLGKRRGLFDGGPSLLSLWCSNSRLE